MRRRTFLKNSSLAATVGMLGLAGCGAPSDGGATPAETDTTTATDGTTTTTAGDGTTPGDGTTATTGDGTTTGEGITTGGTTTVQMVTEDGAYYFDPIGLFVEPGTTVTWVNESGSHSSTSYAQGVGGATVRRIPEGAESWDSGILSEQGASFQYTFEQPGTYDYFCIPHKALGMVGRVVAGNPAGPAAGSMPPDGEVPTSQAIVEQGAISYSEFTQ